jgi:hypothetical protein
MAAPRRKASAAYGVDRDAGRSSASVRARCEASIAIKKKKKMLTEGGRA